MNNFFYSFISGLFCTGALFLLSCITVVGIKFLWGLLRGLLDEDPTASDVPPKRKRRKRRPSPQPSPIRSIEINPEEVDRIYVRKSS